MARAVFMGSPEFAVPSLRALAAAGHDVALVVTQPDRPAGRGAKDTPPPVKVAALELGLDVFQPDTMKDETVRARLRAAAPDVIVVAAYGKILPKAVLAIPPGGCVNVHASLLPRWRGASPIHAAILAGDAETGVTIMEMVSKMDAGAIIASVSTPISPKDTTGTLEPVLARLGADLLVATLPRWLDGRITSVPQDEEEATYCWTLSKTDGQLSRGMSVEAAERAVRANNPWPGAFVMRGEGRLAIWSAEVRNEAHGLEPGGAGIVERLPAIAFADGWLLLREVQKPGKGRISGEQFLAGERGAFSGEVGLRE
jgi:methionyl-tRNA formyltransferase